jgi:hypothetical protein
MDWMQIVWAIGIGGIILFLWPNAKRMLTASPKAQKGDWQAVVIPLAFVVGFVALLILMV